MATGCQNKKEFIFCRKTYHSCLSIELIINMLFRNNRTTGTDPYKTKQRGQTPTKRNSGDRPLQNGTTGTDPYKTEQRGQTPKPQIKKNLVHPKHQAIKNIEIY
nr:hypothetical protein [uncultured Treponema sp.]